MSNNIDLNSYRALIIAGKFTCELCGQVFSNRYSSIVHNSSHIIIPLLQQSLYNCKTDTRDLTTDDVFNKHNTWKQNGKIEITVPEIKLEKLPALLDDEIKQEIDFESSSSSDDEFISDLIKKQIDDVYIKEEFCGNEVNVENIKKKMVFEDDCENSEALKDFTTECKVELDSEWGRCNKEDICRDEKYRVNGIVFEEPVDEFEYDNFVLPEKPLVSREKYDSIHCSDLNSSGIVACKYCSLAFPNRYCLILHETNHMRFRRVRNQFLLCTHCDRYIAGNYHKLDKHLATKHSSCRRRKYELSKCKQCRLPYRKLGRHLKNHHSEGRDVCSEFGSEFNDRKGPEEKLTRVCEICYSCMRDSAKMKYVLTGSVSDERKQRCQRCKKFCTELKTVKSIRKLMKARHQPSSRLDRKPLTNEERLKNIQQRLKLINKLSKFSCVFIYLHKLLIRPA